MSYFVLLAIVIGVVSIGIAGFALIEAWKFGRFRYRCRSSNDDAAITSAAAAVVEARSRLAAVVEADQRAESISMSGNRTRATGLLDGEREAAREALLDAQRLWESIRPRRDTAARVGLWSGRGSIRAWHLGLIGFERTIVRCDHVADPSCWVLREYRRIRFGIGLGAESRSLALFAAGVPSRRLDELVRQLLRGPEFAVRPGWSPVARWRLNQRDHVAQAATAEVLADQDLANAPAGSTTDAVWAAVRADFGDNVGSQPLPGLESPIGVVHATGPSVIIGAWWGTRPRSRVLAASPHAVWRDSL